MRDVAKRARELDRRRVFEIRFGAWGLISSLLSRPSWKDPMLEVPGRF